MQQFKRFTVLTLMAVLVLFLLASCGTFNQNSYRGLGVMQVSYDIAMKSANNLYTKGMISPEGKEDIVKYGNSYAEGHNSAVQAFQDYLNAPSEQKADEKGRAVLAMQSALGFYSSLLTILADHGVYGEPVEPWF
jgi:predicted small secreted protein